MNDDRMDLTGSAAESNTGRWTKQEHELFLKGLNDYGKDWKQIGSLIKTRTVVQIRTHAQKYFLAAKKLEDPSNAASSSSTTIPMRPAAAKKRASSSSLTSGSSTPRAKAKKKSSDVDPAAENPAHGGQHEGDYYRQGNSLSLGDGDEHHLSNLDDVFFTRLVDNWSSESDEGTPTAADDFDLFRSGTGPSVPTTEEADSSASSSPSASLASTDRAMGGKSTYHSTNAFSFPQPRYGHGKSFHPVSATAPPAFGSQNQAVSDAKLQGQTVFTTNNNTLGFPTVGGGGKGTIQHMAASSHQQMNNTALRPSLLVDDLPPLSVTPTPPELHDGLLLDPIPSLDSHALGQWMDAMSE